MITKNYRDNFAYDLNKNVLSKGELFDEDVINQSIELILATNFGERLFNPSFGSELSSFLFNSIDKTTGERLLDSIIASIQRFEDRIYVLSRECRIKINNDTNSLTLTIPYVILKNNIVSMFKKKIML